MAAARGFTIWLTGLPGAGKSSLAAALAAVIRDRGLPVEVIDSGRIRDTPLGATLGFSRDDRDVNVRRHAFAASLLAKNGVVAVVAAVSPYRETRRAVRAQLGDYYEVHVSTPKAVCIERDTRGVWERALQGEIRGFTGVDDPYEAPEHPEARLDLSKLSTSEAVQRLVADLQARGLVPRRLEEPETSEEDRELTREHLQDLGGSS